MDVATCTLMVQLAARLHILNRARFFQPMLEGQLLHLIWSLRFLRFLRVVLLCNTTLRRIGTCMQLGPRHCCLNFCSCGERAEKGCPGERECHGMSMNVQVRIFLWFFMPYFWEYRSRGVTQIHRQICEWKSSIGSIDSEFSKPAPKFGGSEATETTWQPQNVFAVHDYCVSVSLYHLYVYNTWYTFAVWYCRIFPTQIAIG